MKNCVHCNAELPTAAVTCTKCGKRQGLSDEQGMVLLDQPNAPAQQQPPPNAPTTMNPLGTSQASQEAQNRMNEMESMGGELGWKMVPIDGLPSMGVFYPEGTQISIRAAGIGEIRHFSSIDENDPLDMDDKINMIMEKCVRVRFPNKKASHKDIKEEDRFFLIFSIRDLTFVDGENKLTMEMRCGIRCPSDGSFYEKIELTNSNFEYYKISDKLLRFYVSEKACFELPFQDGVIHLYVPSIGVTTWIKTYIRKARMENSWVDTTFLKIAPFMFDDHRTLTEDRYKIMQKESIAWDPLKLSAVLAAVEMIKFGVKTEIRRTCNKCGAEVTAPLVFPGGIKSIFLISDPLGRL